MHEASLVTSNSIFLLFFLGLAIFGLWKLFSPSDDTNPNQDIQSSPTSQQTYARRRSRVSPTKAPEKVQDAARPAPRDGKEKVSIAAMPEGSIIKGKAHVIDGDTIVVNRIKVRLAGIDAPELHQPWGQKSKWEMVSICKGNVITVHMSGETSYDRQVGTCYLSDGTDIGGELITRGLAIDYTIFSNGKYRHLEQPNVRSRLRWSKTVSVKAG